LNFLDSIFFSEKNIKFHENPNRGAEMFHADRRTDGHDEVHSRFSQILQKTTKEGFTGVLISP